MLSYEICEPPTDCSLFWRHFISLVNRDYSELVAKTISNQQLKSVTSNNRAENSNEIGGDLDLLSSDTNISDSNDTVIPIVNYYSSSSITMENNLKKRRGKSIMSTNTFSQSQSSSNNTNNVSSLKNVTINQTKIPVNSQSNIVEEENARFLQQLHELQQSQTNKRVKRQVKIVPNHKRV